MNETVDPSTIEVAHPAPLPPPLRRRFRLGRVALALALAVALIALGLRLENISIATLDASKPSAPAGPPPQSVGVAEAALGDMPITINALGVVTPLATVIIKAQIAGRLMSVGFAEGQLVKAGDFLAQIDDRPYQAALAQAQAQLAKDAAAYDQATADLARYETLAKQDSISTQQVEDQRFTVAQEKAAMGADQAQIDTAKLNIGYCRIVAPTNGRVGLRQVDPGNYVQPTDANGIVVINELDPISVIFSTPEDNLPRITRRLNAGAKLPVAAYDRANVRKIADGELTTFDNEVDTTTGTFKLRATFQNPENALFPSQFVNARLLVDTLNGAVVVPNAAVQLGAPGSFVYVVKDDGTVAVRKIVTGPSDATRTVVESGLAAGDKVVTDGVDRLRDGAKVRVVAAEAGAAAAAAPPATERQGAGQHQHRRSQQGGSAAPASGGAP